MSILTFEEIALYPPKVNQTIDPEQSSSALLHKSTPLVTPDHMEGYKLATAAYVFAAERCDDIGDPSLMPSAAAWAEYRGTQAGLDSKATDYWYKKSVEPIENFMESELLIERPQLKRSLIQNKLIHGRALAKRALDEVAVGEPTKARSQAAKRALLQSISSTCMLSRRGKCDVLSPMAAMQYAVFMAIHPDGNKEVARNNASEGMDQAKKLGDLEQGEIAYEANRQAYRLASTRHDEQRRQEIGRSLLF